jgi:hypothetical protein
VTEQPGGKRSRLRSRAEADALAAEYEASGLSRQEFCQQRQVAFKTLARYLSQSRKRLAAAVPAASARLVRVQVEPPKKAEGELTVIVPGGRQIVVRRGFDADLLQQLVAVLEQT